MHNPYSTTTRNLHFWESSTYPMPLSKLFLVLNAIPLHHVSPKSALGVTLLRWSTPRGFHLAFQIHCQAALYLFFSSESSFNISNCTRHSLAYLFMHMSCLLNQIGCPPRLCPFPSVHLTVWWLPWREPTHLHNAKSATLFLPPNSVRAPLAFHFFPPPPCRFKCSHSSQDHLNGMKPSLAGIGPWLSVHFLSFYSIPLYKHENILLPCCVWECVYLLFS